MYITILWFTTMSRTKWLL